ncbi:MAG TPA: DUF192 domain-containing protein [Anaerovoracaceae bacterium]|nr:DUF192 domain-containing protein [Anaerovoracaceae bacterium]
MLILLKNSHEIIANDVKIADTFFSRLVGWIGKKQIIEEEALLIIPCSGVHTFGMKVPIDVVFLDSNNTVIKTVSKLKPNRITSQHANAAKVLELKAENIEKYGIKNGDTIEVKEKSRN